MAMPALPSPPHHHPLCFPKKDHSLFNSWVKVFPGLLEGVKGAAGGEGDLKITLQATLTTNLTREAMSVVEKPNTF